MQWLTTVANWIFEDNLTPDEKRAAVINRIALHGTPGRRTFESVLARDASCSDNEQRHDGFFVLFTTKEDWQKTNGDFPRTGSIRHAIYRDVDSVDFIGEQIITDGTVVAHAKKNLDENAAKMPGFHSNFFDKESLLVFIHSSHLRDRVEYTKSGNPYLVQAINKTRDPFVTFEAAAVIEQDDPKTGLFNYFILTPDDSLLFASYQKECSRLGKKTAELEAWFQKKKNVGASQSTDD